MTLIKIKETGTYFLINDRKKALHFTEEAVKADLTPVLSDELTEIPKDIDKSKIIVPYVEDRDMVL